MKNREWLLNKMQNMSDEEFEEIVIMDCNSWVSEYKQCGKKNCRNCQRDWLKAEYKEKITLSEAERTILENIDKDYEIISKTKNGNLFVQKANGMRYFFGVFDKKMFDFIVNERFYNIAELLKEE